jgi:hypothetical protein
MLIHTKKNFVLDVQGYSPQCNGSNQVWRAIELSLMRVGVYEVLVAPCFGRQQSDE